MSSLIELKYNTINDATLELGRPTEIHKRLSALSNICMSKDELNGCPCCRCTFNVLLG
ncbi:MAG: hypothetical protein ACI9C4_001717 [Paraglaciecola sp.]|jgi:hypothetical protein